MFQRDYLDGEAGRAGAAEAATCVTTAPVIARHEIQAEAGYSAVLEDLEFMWRWRIYRSGEMCQEGCSLSETASREAVNHVLAFYRVRDCGRESAAAT